MVIKMNKIHVVYWSGTGNTQTMAESIVLGINEAGGNGEAIEVSSITTDALDNSNVFALGCPSMGAEELDYDDMEPFVSELEHKVTGKHILLFGSYDWGDGEWMRNWVDRMKNAGATIVGDEGIIINNSPDDEGIKACIEAGKTLASISI